MMMMMMMMMMSGRHVAIMKPISPRFFDHPSESSEPPDERNPQIIRNETGGQTDRQTDKQTDTLEVLQLARSVTSLWLPNVGHTDASGCIQNTR